MVEEYISLYYDGLVKRDIACAEIRASLDEAALEQIGHYFTPPFQIRIETIPTIENDYTTSKVMSFQSLEEAIAMQCKHGKHFIVYRIPKFASKVYHKNKRTDFLDIVTGKYHIENYKTDEYSGPTLAKELAKRVCLGLKVIASSDGGEVIIRLPLDKYNVMN